MHRDRFQPAPGALSAVLRQLRTLRGRTAQSVAADMGLPLRTYQAFEGGRQRLQLDLIDRFAEALDVDFFAILLEVLLKAPGLAVSSVDNKLATALVFELAAFQRRSGHPAARLRTNELLQAYRAMFDTLVANAAAEREASARLLGEAAVKTVGRDDPSAT